MQINMKKNRKYSTFWKENTIENMTGLKLLPPHDQCNDRDMTLDWKKKKFKNVYF